MASKSQPTGSVRIGPFSIFTLMVLLCLAVFSVLAASTANAAHVSAVKQGAYMADTYANEADAWRFVSQVDKVLGDASKSLGESGSAEQYIDAIKGTLPPGATVSGTQVSGSFATDSGRMLDVVLQVKQGGTFDVVQWSANTNHDDLGSDDILWVP